MVRLTRRDALLSLVGGASTVGLLIHETSRGASGPAELADRHVATLRSVSDAVYPSRVEVSDGFFDGYFDTLGPSRVRATRAAIADLNRLSRRETGHAFHRLEERERVAVLRTLGVNRVDSRPDGTAVERIRYHLVNSLLYALFTSPTGSRLFGVRNPIGHPGGLDAYRHPDRSWTDLVG